MAFEKIKASDIADKDLFKNIVNGLNETLPLLAEMEKTLAEIAKTNIKIAKTKTIEGFGDIEKVAEATEQAEKATKALNKTLTEKEKLQKRLSDLNTAEASELAGLRLQVHERNKALKDEAKELSGAVGLYAKQSQTLNELKAQYKELALAGKENTAESKKMLKQIGDLDNKLKKLDRTVGEGRRTVGLYEIATTKAKEASNKWGKAMKALGIGLIMTAIAGVQTAFAASDEAADESKDKMAGFSAMIQVVGRNIAITFVALFEWLDVFNGKLIVFTLAMKKAGAVTAGFFSGGLDEAKRVGAEIDAEIAHWQNVVDNLKPTNIGDVWKNMGQEIVDLTKKTIVQNDARIEFEKINERAIPIIGALTRKTQALVEINDHDNRTLQERVDLGFEAIEAIREQTAAEGWLLNAELKYINAQIEVAKQASNRAKVIELLSQKQEVLNKKQELQNKLYEQQEKTAKSVLDLLDQELDVVLDLGEKRANVALKASEAEEKSYANRRNFIKQYQDEINNVLDESLSIIEKYDEQVRKTAGNQAGAKLEIGKFIEKGDIQGLKAYIEGLGLVEREVIRVIEVAKLKIDTDAGAIESVKELTEAEKEYAESLLTLQNKEQTLAILTQTKQDAEKVAYEQSQKLFKQKIEMYEKELEAVEKGSEKELEIREKIVDEQLSLIEGQRDKAAEVAEKTLEKEKETLEKENELRQAGLAALKTVLAKRTEAQNAAIDKELDASKNRLTVLQELAAQGDLTAQQSLAAEEKRQAELELARKKAAEKAQRQELAIAAIETYSNKVAAKEENPLISTISDIALLQAFVQSLPAFYEGVQNVGKADLPEIMPNQKDGFLARVHKGERIMPANFNKAIAHISNAKLVRMATEREGRVDLTELKNELSSIKKAIEAQPVYLGRDFEAEKNIVITIIKRENTLEVRKRKNRVI